MRHSTTIVLLFLIVPLVTLTGAERNTAVKIDSRRELFVDDHLIETLRDARRELHHPTPHDLAIVHDAPWEGPGSGYHSILRDGDIIRMYYRGSVVTVENGELKLGPQACCYAESRDGMRFTKPELGLYEYNGSKRNNIIWTGVGKHNFAPFIDTRPNCPAEYRLKALGGVPSEGGLFAFHSADGIHWSLIRDEPVVTEGAFDSQNLAFWDDTAGVYRAYFRTLTSGVTTSKEGKPGRYRSIRTATSRDFLTWDNYVDLTYENSPIEHLYTNQVAPYFRAPHILIGFPTRYIERGWANSMRALPELPLREKRADAHLRYGTALTEALLMASRDGVHFERWNEAFLRPGPQRPRTWIYGHQYIAWHAIETRSPFPGAANEMTFYATEGPWHGKSNALRRYTMRLDGFVSVNAPLSGGELLTKQIQFTGKHLTLNFSTSAAGGIRVELQDTNGKPLPGFALQDCSPIFGDTIERTVAWGEGNDVSKFAGKPIRLRIELKDADLYSFQFVDGDT